MIGEEILLHIRYVRRNGNSFQSLVEYWTNIFYLVVWKLMKMERDFIRCKTFLLLRLHIRILISVLFQFQTANAIFKSYSLFDNSHKKNLPAQNMHSKQGHYNSLAEFITLRIRYSKCYSVHLSVKIGLYFIFVLKSETFCTIKILFFSQ